MRFQMSFQHVCQPCSELQEAWSSYHPQFLFIQFPISPLLLACLNQTEEATLLEIQFNQILAPSFPQQALLQRPVFRRPVQQLGHHNHRISCYLRRMPLKLEAPFSIIQAASWQPLPLLPPVSQVCVCFSSQSQTSSVKWEQVQLYMPCWQQLLMEFEQQG